MEFNNMMGMSATAPQVGNVPEGDSPDILDGLTPDITPDATPDDGNVAPIPEGTEPPATPKKFAGMYDTVEQLENAYKGLQTKYQTTKKDLMGRLTEDPQQAAPVQAVPQQILPNFQSMQLPPNVNPALIQQAFAENPEGTLRLLTDMRINQAVAPMQQQLQRFALQTEIDATKNKYNDFSEYEDKVGDMLKANPALMQSKNRIELAYKLVKADAITPLVQQAMQNGVQQGYNAALQKKGIPQSGVGTSVPPAAPKTQAQSIVDDMLEIAKVRSIF